VSGPTALYRLMGCRVLGREGTVISSDNRVIESLTYTDAEGGLDSHPVFRRRRFPKPVLLRGTYATITYPSSFAWYHWVSESLPRLQLLQSSLGALDGLFVPADVEPQLIESLEAMGVLRQQLIPLAMGSHFQPQALLAPRYCAGLNIPHWVPRFLQEAIGLNPDIPLVSGRKLYISRADAGKRRVLNEEQLLPLLEAAGFTIIRLREHSFLEQARLFHEASWVIGPHGAGLVNVLYSRPGVQIIELSPCSSAGPGLFHSASTCVGGTYWWLPGQPQGPATSPPVHQDFVLDPQHLAEALAHTGADQ
jgi:capsular polysaccharide biosynthesis protein